MKRLTSYNIKLISTLTSNKSYCRKILVAFQRNISGFKCSADVNLMSHTLLKIFLKSRILMMRINYSTSLKPCHDWRNHNLSLKKNRFLCDFAQWGKSLLFRQRNIFRFSGFVYLAPTTRHNYSVFILYLSSPEQSTHMLIYHLVAICDLSIMEGVLH